MADLKTYDIINVDPIRKYILDNGEKRILEKGKYFGRMGESIKEFGIVSDGCLAFMHTDYRGENQILTFAMKDEFIGAFASPGQRSWYDIQALCKSEIHIVLLNDLIQHIENNLPKNTLQNFIYAVAFGFMIRGTSYRCDSPEMRYLELINRLPDISQKIPMKAIASYLGISREHFSRMRSRLKT